MGAFVTITHLQHATTKGESIMKKITVCLIIALLSGVLSACQAAAPSDSASPRQTPPSPVQDASTQPVTTTAVFDPVITPSTNPSTKPAPSPLTMIYEVDPVYSAEDGLQHTNIISGMPEFSVEDLVTKELTAKLGGVNHNLRYERTLYYPIGDETVHQYFVNDEDQYGILLKKDGTIHSLLYDFATLNISKTESPEQILPLLQTELNKWFDMDRYEYIRLPEARHDANGFGIYDFLFYNQIGNYITGYMIVAVNDEGKVFGCKTKNLPEDVEISSLSIDENLEHEFIELKMKDLYKTSEKQEYKEYSYDERFPPQIVMYKNELCVQYTVLAKLILKDYEGEIGSYLHTILIPLALLTPETISQTQ